ncbi:TetR/AcrR family transcriptional regulator [Phytoactinopolyspora endophytica]|uniref:TetR/AcrR family transcriptional regulator n=1 Tax=Phytoactinopolyspora endophytica TaxID=1642495 RepID=UPI00101BFEC7|nr:TetR/AcrR family transcriptional regulator [Phytoactinopolyspora endophytica]
MDVKERVDGRLVRGQRTREAVLDAAVSLASVHGLDGLSLGRLADHLDVSKSGLFAHWRTKEQLQLDTIEQARRQWTDRVIAPALTAPHGLRRLFAVHESRLAFYADGVLPGGCFFLAAQTEYDDRDGAVRERVGAAVNEWLTFIRSLVDDAIARGELAADVDAGQLTFEIDALGEMTVIHARLADHAGTYRYARRAVLDRLRHLAADPTILPAE